MLRSTPLVSQKEAESSGEPEENSYVLNDDSSSQFSQPYGGSTPGSHQGDRSRPTDSAGDFIDTEFDIHREAHQKYLKRQQDEARDGDEASHRGSTSEDNAEETLENAFPPQKSLRNCFGALPWIKSTKLFKIIFPNKLDIVSGVIIPIILNTFGVILFLRLGQIVGKVGFIYTFAMFIIAYASMAFTILSLSAIATNGRVRGGGVYFMISRVLGPEFGAAIGLIFFCGNLFGGAMYILGFVEALLKTFDGIHFTADTLVFSSALLFVLACVVMLGAAIFSKTTLINVSIVLIAVTVMLITFIFQSPGAANGAYEGWKIDTLKDNLFATFGDKSAFSVLQTYFGILYPATTGFLAGAALSGDLKNVARDLPRGTILASCVTFVVYVGLAFITAFTMNNYALINNTNVMTDVSLVPVIMTIGIFTSTIGAALMSIIAGSRILQALARDRLLPFLFLFGKGFGKNDEPRIAIILTWFLLQCILFIGKLDVVAPFVSLFYVLAYLLINLACFALSATDAPNFRPSFKYFNKYTALCGSLISVVIMFFINPLYASITFFLMLAIMIFVHFYAPAKNWGSIGRAIIYYQTRKYNLKMDDRNLDHIKYWRFKALVLCSNPRSNYDLLSFINSVTKHRGGIAICGHVDTRSFRSHLEHHRRENENYYLLAKLSKWNMFTTRIHGADIREGSRNLLTASGMSHMEPNTLVLGFYDDTLPQQRIINTKTKRGKKIQRALAAFPPLRTTDHHALDLDEYMEIIKDAYLLEKNIVIARNFHKLSETELVPHSFFKRLAHVKERTIDLWMLCFNQNNDEIEATLSLMLQMSYLIKCSNVWKKYHKLRVMVIIDQTADYKKEKKRISKLLHLARINAKPHVIQLTNKDFDILEAEPDKKVKLEKTGKDASEFRVRLQEDSLLSPPADTESINLTNKNLLTSNSADVEMDSVVIDIPGSESPSPAADGISSPPAKQLTSAMRKRSLPKTSDESKASKDEEKKNAVPSVSVKRSSSDMGAAPSSGLKPSRSVHFGDATVVQPDDKSTTSSIKSPREEKIPRSESKLKLALKKKFSKHRRSASMPSFGMSRTASIDFVTRSFSIGDIQLQFPPTTQIFRENGEMLTEVEKNTVLNHIIKSNSSSASVVLISMPPPPPVFNQATHKEYHRSMTKLTDGLPASMLVFGHHQTISVNWD